MYRKEWEVKDFAKHLAKLNGRDKPYSQAYIRQMLHGYKIKSGKHEAKLPPGFDWTYRLNRVIIFEVPIKQQDLASTPGASQKSKLAEYPDIDFDVLEKESREEVRQALSVINGFPSAIANRAVIEWLLSRWYLDTTIHAEKEPPKPRFDVPQLQFGHELFHLLADTYTDAVVYEDDIVLKARFKPDGKWSFEPDEDECGIAGVIRFNQELNRSITPTERLLLFTWHVQAHEAAKGIRKKGRSVALPVKYFDESLKLKSKELKQICLHCGKDLKAKKGEFCPGTCREPYRKWIVRRAADIHKGKSITLDLLEKLRPGRRTSK